MQIKIDIKTLIIGIISGVVLTAVIGADIGSADADRFGIAVNDKGYAVVRTDDGGLYIINPNRGMAVRVLHAPSLSDNPDNSRNSRGRLFNLSSGVSRKNDYQK